MVNSGVVAAIHVSGVRCDPCGAVRCTAPQKFLDFKLSSDFSKVQTYSLKMIS